MTPGRERSKPDRVPYWSNLRPEKLLQCVAITVIPRYGVNRGGLDIRVSPRRESNISPAITSDNRTRWIPLLLFAAGMVIAFGPSLVGGLRLIPEYSVDPRFNHYLLEHAFRWLRGDALHASVWSPPFFHPAREVLGYSDAMLGLAWLYAPWRAAGASPYAAYALWLMALAALNFTAFYTAVRNWLGVGRVAASVAACVFTFGVPRMAQLAHPQLWSHAFILLLLHGLVLAGRAARDPASGQRLAWRGWSCVVAGAAGQFYTAFYPLWFIGFGLVLAALVATGFREGRARLGRMARQPAAWVAALAVVAACWPLLRIYLDALAMAGPRAASEVRDLLPEWRSWWYVGERHLLYGWVFERWPSLAPGTARHEQVLSVGWVTSLAALAGLAGLARRAWWGRVVALSLLALVVVTLRYGHAGSPWFVLDDLVPGASAIRAVARVGMTAMIPLCLGLAWAVEQALGRGRIGWLLAAVVLAEQVSPVVAVDVQPLRARTEAMAARLDPADGPVYLVVPVEAGYRRGAEYDFHIEAMWAGLTAGVPVVNGYSGLIPADWMVLYFNTYRNEEEAAVLDQRLAGWAGRFGIEPPLLRMLNLQPTEEQP